jgi:hypothetical protein
MEPAADTSTEKAAAIMKSEMDRLGKLIEAAGIRPE